MVSWGNFLALQNLQGCIDGNLNASVGIERCLTAGIGIRVPTATPTFNLLELGIRISEGKLFMDCKLKCVPMEMSDSMPV